MTSLGGKKDYPLIKWVLTISLIYLGTVLSGCSNSGSKDGKIAAPAFTLKDLSGQEVSLSDFRGKVVLLDFWATWCPPCLVSVPHLNALYQTHMGDGLVVLGISLDQGDASSLSAFIKTMKITYPVLIGTAEVAEKYDIKPIPASFLIDRRGNMRARLIGFNDAIGERMVLEIENLLKEQ